MTKCILLEETTLDTSGLRSYGEEVVLFPAGCRRPSIWTPQFIEAVFDRLDEIGYRPETDYLVVIGHMVPMVIASTSMTAKYGPLQVLCFSSTERVYVPRHIGGVTCET